MPSAKSHISLIPFSLQSANVSQSSEIPLPSQSTIAVSQASPTPSPLQSSCPGFGTSGQLSTLSSHPSPSVSGPDASRTRISATIPKVQWGTQKYGISIGASAGTTHSNVGVLALRSPSNKPSAVQFEPEVTVWLPPVRVQIIVSPIFTST